MKRIILTLTLALAVAVLGHGDRTSVATAQAPPAFVGTVPGPGQHGNLLTAKESTPAGLITALQHASCDAAMFALLSVSTQEWSLYVVGAPAFVNADFPETLAAETIFFVRCAAPAVSYEQWAAAACAVLQEAQAAYLSLTPDARGVDLDEMTFEEWKADSYELALILVSILGDIANRFEALEAPADLVASGDAIAAAYRDFASWLEETAPLALAIESREEWEAWYVHANERGGLLGNGLMSNEVSAVLDALPAPARDAVEQIRATTGCGL